MTTSQNKILFNDYDGFVEKFKPKHTTDDCYTPPEVYDVILHYVNNSILPLSSLKVERPFFPGGDYIAASASYDSHTIVIDNPPFSILSKIIRFYTERNIKFFLFAPHLTIFSANLDCQYIIVNATITYHNGANINTSFITNMLNHDRYITFDGSLRADILNAQKKARKTTAKPSYIYPDNVITSTSLDSSLRHGAVCTLRRSECHRITRLDSQRRLRRSIFGNGFLISNAASHRIKQTKVKATQAQAQAQADAARLLNSITWTLSHDELSIINNLDHND